MIARGMIGDKALMVERLGAVNYYRLSGYWFPFREVDPADPSKRLDTFKAGTCFSDVWNRYTFDRRLRLIAMDAVERIEIAVRSSLALRHSCTHSPFAYASDDPQALPFLKQKDYGGFIGPILQEQARSKETFIMHFTTVYGDAHRYLPIWMVTEIMTFGTMLTLFRSSSSKIQREVAKPFGVHDTVFDSWLLSLNTIRNICAHHGRLWNRELGVKPLIPSRAKQPQWHVPVTVNNDRIFGVLTILKYCLDRIAPQSQWSARLFQLLSEYPNVPRASMGFPANWCNCPIWSLSNNTGVVHGSGDGI
ncbi:MAG TPA: Abi family protein [Phycisphaerae bacterium]|nr:Abi family protein [Phycisphaerae bacterium]